MSFPPDPEPDVEKTVPGAPVSVEALEELNRLRVMARILANAAHDVNNALQIISGSVELLQARPDLPAAIERRAEIIATHATRAAVTIHELSSYSRVERGRQRLDLAVLVSTAFTLRQYTWGRAGITGVLERSDEAAYPIIADRQEILQVVLNLVLNAEGALAGRERPRITVRLDRGAQDVTMRVADNGSGITATDRARLDDRDWMNRVTLDAGQLGLWIAARLAARNRGRLAFVAAPDQSTAVELTLPRGEP